VITGLDSEPLSVITKSEGMSVIIGTSDVYSTAEFFFLQLMFHWIVLQYFLFARINVSVFSVNHITCVCRDACD